VALVIPVGFASFSIEITHARDAQPYNVTFGTETDLSEASAIDHANHAMSSFGGAFVSRLDSETFITKATGRFGQDGEDVLIIDSDLAPMGGTRSGSSVPPNTAVLVRKLSGLGGRRNRGRCYVPMAATAGAETEGGVLSTGERTALQTSANAWFNNLATGVPPDVPPMPMVILHNEPPGGGVLPLPTPVVGLTVDTTLATQRRRLRR
jgi:hypothetical protein